MNVYNNIQIHQPGEPLFTIAPYLHHAGANKHVWGTVLTPLYTYLLQPAIDFLYWWEEGSNRVKHWANAIGLH